MTINISARPASRLLRSLPRRNGSTPRSVCAVCYRRASTDRPMILQRKSQSPSKPQQSEIQTHRTNAKPKPSKTKTSNPPKVSGRLDQVEAYPPPEDFTSTTFPTPAPTAAQLSYANHFFSISASSHHTSFLLSTPTFRLLPPSDTLPEVVFLGRSNVGKSSVLNALLQRSGLAAASSKPGRTRQMGLYGVGGVRLAGGGSPHSTGRLVREGGGLRGGAVVVLDMPGYGEGSRPGWGAEIVKYLTGRRQLRRAFVLIDAHHGVMPTDRQLLALLREHGVPHQLVLSKVDKLVMPRGRKGPEAVAQRMGALQGVFDKVRAEVFATRDEMPKGIMPLDEILSCSSAESVPPVGGTKIGMNNLRWAVLTAAGLQSDTRGRVVRLEGDVVRQEAGS